MPLRKAGQQSKKAVKKTKNPLEDYLTRTKKLIIVRVLLTALVVVSIVLIWEQVALYLQRKSLNEQMQADLFATANALYRYQYQNDGELPDPTGHLRYFTKSGIPLKSAQGAYFVVGAMDESVLLPEYLFPMPRDPRTGHYYAYSRTVDHKYFQLGAIAYSARGPFAYTEGNFPNQFSLASLVPAYDGQDFIINGSHDYLPYDPNLILAELPNPPRNVAPPEIEERRPYYITKAVRPLIKYLTVENEKTTIDLHVPWLNFLDIDGFTVRVNGREIYRSTEQETTIVFDEELQGLVDVTAYSSKRISTPSLAVYVESSPFTFDGSLFLAEIASFAECGNNYVDEGEICDGDALGDLPENAVCNFDCKTYRCEGGYELIADSCFLNDFTAPIIAVNPPDEWSNTPQTVRVECADNTECDVSSYRLAAMSDADHDCPDAYADYEMVTEGGDYTFDGHDYICAAGKDNVGNVGYSEKSVEVKIDADKPEVEVTLSPDPYTSRHKGTARRVTLEGKDESSEVTAIYYSYQPVFDPQGEGILYEEPFEVEEEAVIYLVAIDKAGNESNWQRQMLCPVDTVYDEAIDVCLPLERVQFCKDPFKPELATEWAEPEGVDKKTGEYFTSLVGDEYQPDSNDCRWDCTDPNEHRELNSCVENKQVANCGDFILVNPPPADNGWYWLPALNSRGEEVPVDANGSFITEWDPELKDYDPPRSGVSCNWACSEGLHRARGSNQCGVSQKTVSCFDYADPKPPAGFNVEWNQAVKFDGSSVFVGNDGSLSVEWNPTVQSFDPPLNSRSCQWECPEGLFKSGSNCVQY